MNLALNRDVILFDGAMGTYLAQKYNAKIKRCEYQNLDNPDYVLDIHKEYIRAGADAIKTNTFFANTAALGADFGTVEKVIRQGCELAKMAAAGTDTLVFGSIGPILNTEYETAISEYKRIINVFFACDVRCFLFETFNEYDILIDLAKYIKELSQNAYVIAECTVNADAYTQSGISAQEAVAGLSAVPEIDACGFNCTCGPLHLLNIIKGLNFNGKPLSVMPNAGYPSVISGRTVFQSAPDYFSNQMMKIMSLGAKFIGGCCGTTPEHIAELSRNIKNKENERFTEPEVKASYPITPRFDEPKKSIGKFVAVELDSPLDSNMEFFLNSAKAIKESGADIITIADCPIARARVDSSLLAAKLKREYGIEAMPHMTCRDRNLNATKALLLGLNAENVSNILVVTGDPIASDDRESIKSVFNFNSIKLASFIRDLNNTIFSNRRLSVYAALNVNAVNFNAELAKAKRKEEAGVEGFLTQPVYSDEAIENIVTAKNQLKSVILGGIMPVVSYRNAMFINNEIAGITIPDRIIRLYENADQHHAKQLAVETSMEIAEKMKNIIDGYYLVTPLKKVDIICEIIKKLK